MFQKIRFFFILFPFFCLGIAHAQQKVIHNTLAWSDSLKWMGFSDNKPRKVLYFNLAGYDIKRFGSLPVFTQSAYLSFNSGANAEIKNAVYTPIKQLPSDIQLMSSRIGAAATVTVGIAYEKKRPVANVYIIPIRRNAQSGAYEKLVSFDLVVNIEEGAGGQTRGGRTYAQNSVLASGSWYKIAVNKDGIYKIDKSFLQSLGINVSSINPNNIRVYGNGGGMLPEINNAFKYDDLQENAILVHGSADGKFDDTDYVLFYGQGPVRWGEDSINRLFSHTQNLYSDYTYYFINTDIGPGKRITPQASSSQTPNNTFNYFNDYQVHELDTVNLDKSGRLWFGEEFQYIPSQNFSFNTPDILCDSIATLRVAVASFSPDVSRVFYVTINGHQYSTESLGPSTNTFEGNVASYASDSFRFKTCSALTSINLSYSSTANEANGWLDYIELNVERKLNVSGGQLPFRVINSVSNTKYSQYVFQQASPLLNIWDVTDPLNVKNQALVASGGSASFTLQTPTLHQFVAFNNSTGSFLTPATVGSKMRNQNLHALANKDYIIITPSSLNAEAQDLANFHASAMRTLVVNVEDIYNEFGNGSPDISAVRDFVKMLFDRAPDSASMPKYLVLFGDASYDYKNRLPNNTNLVPTYESVESLNTTSTFNTDDYFGILEDGQGDMLAYNSKMDVAVGRLPVKSPSEATDLVNKIKTYVSSSSFGNWRNSLTFCADDEDYNTHFNGAEQVANYVSANYPSYNIDKIYLDAYHQVSTPGGSRYPDVNTAITNKIAQGTLIFNYVGHGGPNGLAAERILSNSDFIAWTNCFKLPLFVTATCDFSVFDEPQLTSAGEYLMLNPCGGAIAMITTVRLVYSFANEDLNQNFTNQIFRTINGKPIEIGTALKLGKNNVSTDPVNNHKFCMLGDPALTLASTADQIITSTINTKPIITNKDTLKALEKVTITGYVADPNGNKLTTFNGTLFPTLYDKFVTYSTLGNDPTSIIAPFVLQNSLLYNGKASVTNGGFTFTFIVPKDISYKFGPGKISYYASNNNISASGYRNDVIVGGFADSASIDKVGPNINLYMNDMNFVFGGTTDQNPNLIVKLKDPSGINTVGTGLGHDITGTLDNNSQGSFVLNNFYQANLDDFTQGSIQYPLSGLSTGLHTISVKAWDVYDNSNQAYTEFIVANSASMALTHVLNYPNPFTTNTEFMFEENMPGSLLNIQIDIFTVSGKRIKTITTTAGTAPVANITGNQCNIETIPGSYRVDGIKWDGRDDYGDPIGKGVYIYRVSVRSDNGLHADKFEKLVLLK